MIKAKKFEIFCGTGGVGKTTLSASRALYLAKKNKRVLLITIDPSRRLKEVLSISDNDAGEIVTVDQSNLKLSVAKKNIFQFDALLFSPYKAMEKILKIHGLNISSQGKMLNILTRPNGGLTEILSIVEIQKIINDENYDHIILDTAPGKHFLDFLNSCHKINRFFDKTYIDIFKFLGKKYIESKMPFKNKLLPVLMSTGIKKLLTHLQKVTGKTFVDDFIDTVSLLHQTKDTFINALSIEDSFKDKELSNWYLVTNVEHYKVYEINQMKNNADELMHEDNFALINKSILKTLIHDNGEEEIEKLIQKPKSINNKLLKNLVERERSIKEQLNNVFDHTKEFYEIMSNDPQDHVLELSKQW
jgi:anion-transporting  ArsA/GET3 family ATPase